MDMIPFDDRDGFIWLTAGWFRGAMPSCMC